MTEEQQQAYWRRYADSVRALSATEMEARAKRQQDGMRNSQGHAMSYGRAMMNARRLNLDLYAGTYGGTVTDDPPPRPPSLWARIKRWVTT